MIIFELISFFWKGRNAIVFIRVLKLYYYYPWNFLKYHLKNFCHQVPYQKKSYRRFYVIYIEIDVIMVLHPGWKIPDWCHVRPQKGVSCTFDTISKRPKVSWWLKGWLKMQVKGSDPARDKFHQVECKVLCYMHQNIYSLYGKRDEITDNRTNNVSFAICQYWSRWRTLITRTDGFQFDNTYVSLMCIFLFCFNDGVSITNIASTIVFKIIKIKDAN